MDRQLGVFGPRDVLPGKSVARLHVHTIGLADTGRVVSAARATPAQIIGIPKRGSYVVVVIPPSCLTAPLGPVFDMEECCVQR